MAKSLERLSASPCGRIVRGIEGYETFVPSILPRTLTLNENTIYLLDEASRAVAMLSGVGETLANPRLLINPFLRREAVLSSRIEGTVSSLADVFRYEAFEDRGSALSSDTREVINYVWALEDGLSLLEGRPLATDLINKVHERLMTGVRGQYKSPGQLRRSQVWIQGSEFTPPAAEFVPDLLRDLELFMNEDTMLPPLIQCALAHYQFETIYPYEDGNGRTGRLLIVLLLFAKRVLTTPLLYLSAYFERKRTDYLDGLFNLSVTGNWSAWLDFFLKGVAEQANDALSRSRQLRDLHARYRDQLQRARYSGKALQLLDELFAMPVATAPNAARTLGISTEGARQILERLVTAGILEVNKKQWPHFYVSSEVLAIVE